MLLFPLYAAIVWYGCYRFRRQFLGYAAFAAGVLGIVLLLWLDIRLTRWLLNQHPAPGLLMMLSAEGCIVFLIGGYLVMTPRERAAMPCRRCAYELAGLDDHDPRCPECGLERAAKRGDLPPAPPAEPMPVATAKHAA